MDAVENTSHWYSLSPLSLKYILQIAGLARTTRCKYFGKYSTNFVYNLYIIQDNHFMKNEVYNFSSFQKSKKSFSPFNKVHTRFILAVSAIWPLIQFTNLLNSVGCRWLSSQHHIFPILEVQRTTKKSTG